MPIHLSAPVASHTLLWPMLAHMAWVFVLYAWLTFERQRAVRRGEVEYGVFVRGEEPHHIARITRNLANQFELPAIFYALAVLLVATNNVIVIDIIAAWVSSPAGSCTRWCKASPTMCRCVARYS